jgi:hypothetical protein
VRVWLPRRSRVTEVGIVFRHGVSDAGSPRLCSIQVGEDDTALRTVVRDFELPRGPPGTQIFVPVWSNTAAPLFPYGAISTWAKLRSEKMSGLTGRCAARRSAPVGRVVVVALRGLPPNTVMTLGQAR